MNFLSDLSAKLLSGGPLMLPGFFGTRADMLMDIILVVIISLPALLSYSMRMARTKNYQTHKKIQIWSFFVVMIAVILFELNIRRNGGSGSLLAGSPFAERMAFQAFLLLHITISVLTFLAWGILLALSTPALKKKKLPGSFSGFHKRVGFYIFLGVTMTALTGMVVYLCAFVAELPVTG